MANALINPTPLARAITAAQTGRVPVMYYADSTSYTNGGYAQGLYLAMRNYGSIFAGPLAASGQASHSQRCVPGQNASGDGWSPAAFGIGNMTSATTGAPAAQEAVYKSYSSIGYLYVADGVTGTSFSAGSIANPFGGLNQRVAVRFHIWDATFASGSGKHVWSMRYSASPFTTIVNATTFNSNTGTVARRHSYIDAAADAARSLTLGLEMQGCAGNNGLGPFHVYGSCWESPTVMSGYMATAGVNSGGNSSGNNLDEILMARQSHKERWAMLRDVVGTGSTAIALISYGFNDRNSTAASHQYSGLVVGSASTTTCVIDDTSGTAFDNTYSITKRSAALAIETKVVSSYDAGTKTVTVGSAWTTQPAAGDVWRISKTAALENTQTGYYNTIKKMKSVIAADAALAGFSDVVVVVIPAWQDSSTPNATLLAYEAAAAQLASEDAAVTAVATNTMFPFARLQAMPYGGTTADTIHIGGYAQAAIIDGVWSEAMRAGQAATDTAAVDAAKSGINNTVTVLGITGTQDVSAIQAAAAAAQLVTDKAAVTAQAGKIVSTATVLTVQGTHVEPAAGSVAYGVQYGDPASLTTGTAVLTEDEVATAVSDIAAKVNALVDVAPDNKLTVAADGTAAIDPQAIANAVNNLAPEGEQQDGSLGERVDGIASNGDSAKIDAIKRQTDKLTTGQINIVSPYANGTITIKQGDTYGTDAGQVIDIPEPDGSQWPGDLTGWTVALTARRGADNANAGTTTFSTAVTVVSPDSAPRTLRLASLAPSDTQGLAVGAWDFSVAATSGSLVNTLLSGLLTIVDEVRAE